MTAATNAAAWPGVKAVAEVWRPSTSAARYTTVSGLATVTAASVAKACKGVRSVAPTEDAVTEAR